MSEQASDSLYLDVFDFWKRVSERNHSYLERTSVVAMIVATWVAAQPKKTPEEALADLDMIVTNVLPLVSEKFADAIKGRIQ